MRLFESINLENNVFQLTLTEEEEYKGFVWGTKEVEESYLEKVKKHWWNEAKHVERRKKVEKEGWHMSSGRGAYGNKYYSDDESLLNNLNYYSRGADYTSAAEPFYIKDKKIFRRHEVKFILLGKRVIQGKEETTSLTYKFYFETWEEAMNAYTLIKTKNPQITEIIKSKNEDGKK